VGCSWEAVAGGPVMTASVHPVLELYCASCESKGNRASRLALARRRPHVRDEVGVTNWAGRGRLKKIERPQGGYKHGLFCERCLAQPQVTEERITAILDEMEAAGTFHRRLSI